MRKTYHFYKTDILRSSRVLMQATWDDASVFIDRSHRLPGEIDRLGLSWKMTLKLALKELSPAVYVFHAQSSLPYLLMFMSLRLGRGARDVFIYDMHDLHERPEARLWKINAMVGMCRYLILGALERLVFRTHKIHKITVSEGLARIASTKYGVKMPAVVRNVPAIMGIAESPSWNSRSNTLLYFGTPQRAPVKLIREIVSIGLKLDLYGRGITPDWLRENIIPSEYLQSVAILGPYVPSEMQFIQGYKFLLIFEPSSRSLNFRYSLPNKLFQALEAGLSVLVSSNFQEMIELFGSIPGAVTVVVPGKLKEAIREATVARPVNYDQLVREFLNDLTMKSRAEYTRACVCE